MSTAPEHSEQSKPRWQPITAIERRVLGVLVEKAKTVPESYPMTPAGIRTACNQKNNRYPLMQLEEEQLDGPLERLRSLGAVALVQGSGRVEKFRHYASDWLGVDKLELAVMTELLLRGAQTEGELRQRASRMEQIVDLTTLRTVLKSLEAKNLVISLTSAGRGHVVTHNLYEEREMEKVRREYEGQGSGGGTQSPGTGDDDEADEPAAAAGPSVRDLVAELRRDLDALRDTVNLMRDEIANLRHPPL